jgi:hypothetical protein
MASAARLAFIVPTDIIFTVLSVLLFKRVLRAE